MGYFVEIDNREKLSRQMNAKDYFGKFTDDVHIKELTFGDYIFNKTVVFEYKTLKDFIHSVKSGRVFNQAIDQSTTYKYHFVVVVSNSRERKAYFSRLRNFANTGRYFNEAMFIGAIARLNTFTTVIQAETEEEAFLFMRVQAKKCLDNKHIVKRLHEKTDNTAFNWLMNIKNISDKKASLIVDALELETLEDLLSLDIVDIQRVNGIGSKTASIVMKSLKGKK